QPHPYPFGFDYWDAVKLIEPQLDDPARVEEIYQMMVPVWEATPQDDRMYALRRQAFENLTAFRQRTFTLFAEHKEPAAPAMSQASLRPGLWSFGKWDYCVEPAGERTRGLQNGCPHRAGPHGNDL